MQYKVGDKVRLKSGKDVTIVGDGYAGIYQDEKSIVIFKDDYIDEKEKEKTIYVPDCIHINTFVPKGFSLGIINQDGYELAYSYEDEGYYVTKDTIEEFSKTKLIKTTWGKLNPGDICYVSGGVDCLDDISDIRYYGLKLKDNSLQSWDDKDCVNDDSYKNEEIVYKVVLA